MNTATRTALTGVAIAGFLSGCGDDPATPEAQTTTESVAPAAEATPPPASQMASGKTPVTVSEGTNLSFSLSPDGGTLVFSLQGVLFSVPVSGGPATVLTDYYQDAREPVWNRDGSLIIYQGYRSGNWDLWSLPVAGGDPLPLTTDAFDDREPQVSPSGAQIAFSSDRSGNYDIWLLSVADGSLTQVTDTPENESGPAWSPDGNEIAYAASANRQNAEVRSTNLITRETRMLAADSGSVAGISWHPDGSRLTYQNALPGSTSLKALTPATGMSETLSQPDDDIFPFRATWAADGSLLYAGNGGIQRQGADGSRAPIPFEATFELDRPDYQRRRRDHDDVAPRQALGLSQPVISPDGQQIAFTALGDIWLWSPDAQQLRNATDSPFAERSPQYSPDGNRIAYISDRGAGGGQSSALWIYDIAQGTHTQVSLPSEQRLRAGLPSPDGNSVALFASIAGSPLASQLTIANLEDGSLTPVHTPIPDPGDLLEQRWCLCRHHGAGALTPAVIREGVYQMVVTSPDHGRAVSGGTRSAQEHDQRRR